MKDNFTPLPDRVSTQSHTQNELTVKIGMFILGAICALLVIACISAIVKSMAKPDVTPKENSQSSIQNSLYISQITS